jgi:hypothetical protein
MDADAITGALQVPHDLIPLGEQDEWLVSFFSVLIADCLEKYCGKSPDSV